MNRATIVGLACLAYTAASNGASEFVQEAYSARVSKLLELDKAVLENPIDVKSIGALVRQNQARAVLKFGKPAVYSGIVKSVEVTSSGDADLIVDSGEKAEIVVVLYPYQIISYEQTQEGWVASDVGTAMEFASDLNSGENFIFNVRTRCH
ncbi:hypothetical protein [Pseudomonas sp. PA27(2017)]|uniref:hypothetical protein n=1 Tax=Pseudomonas sp. PA27(2017) TaxID=1932112 RepID=UPI00095FB527|nr:hypothetical protein [Pseudomonas sp. PA27(2017)]OLU35338.1 hypothetical protein BVH06_02990 [Pseudomonas sp. PA27(2017)]